MLNHYIIIDRHAPTYWNLKKVLQFNTTTMNNKFEEVFHTRGFPKSKYLFLESAKVYGLLSLRTIFYNALIYLTLLNGSSCKSKDFLQKAI